MAWVRHAQDKKKVIIVKNNDYDAVWWSERSMKLCGAHIITITDVDSGAVCF